MRLLVWCVTAVVVPFAFLHLTCEADRRAAGMTAAPFAWPRLLAAHLVTALPAGLIVAQWLRAHPAVNEMARGLWVVIGFGTAGFTALVGPAIGEVIVSSDFGIMPLSLLRATVAALLVLPWCVLALPAATAAGAFDRPGIVFGVGMALAVIPCGMYADVIAAARTEQVRDLLARERLVKAEPVLIGLCELGSSRPIGGSLPVELRKEVTLRIQKLRRAVERPLSPLASPQDQIGRALLMMQLDRLDEAASSLEQFARGDDTVTLLLATVYRDQERWSESDALYSDVLEKRLSMALTHPAARAACLTAIEGLVFNARSDRRPHEAERVLRRGLDALPADAAYFHFQLGKHYQDGGRPHLAVEHLRTAERLNPDRYREPANQLIQSMRTSTPACLQH
jgi:hypothetical protein